MPGKDRNFDVVDRALAQVIDTLGTYPGDPAPSTPLPIRAATIDASADTLMQDPAIRQVLERALEAIPDPTFRAFVGTGQVLSALVAMHGAGTTRLPRPIEAAAMDPTIFRLMRISATVAKDREPGASRSELLARVGHPEGMLALLQKEVERHTRKRWMPFGWTMSTLLGPDAMHYLTAPSASGRAHIKPHELSRVGWATLDSIKTQVEIETELEQHGRNDAFSTKAAVALAWSLVALASFLDPCLFLTDHEAYLSGVRDGRVSWSSGIGTRTIVEHDGRSMLDMLRVVRAALAADDVTACDVMWIATALARRRSVASTGVRALPSEPPRFSAFLSHRGRDAKAALARALIDDRRGAFLDCLALPTGVVNRRFVFESLARSARVIVVTTPSYEASAWCRKERWLARELAALGRAQVEERSLDDTLAILPGLRAAPPEPGPGLPYPFSSRILSDLASDDRPTGVDPVVFAPLAAICARSEDERPDPATLAELVLALWEDILEVAPHAEPFTSWSRAAAFSVAALGAGCAAESKTDVRHVVQHLEEALRAIRDDAEPRTVALACASAVLELCDQRPAPPTAAALDSVVAGLGVYRGGVVLVDARPVATREARLRLALRLISSDLRGVGIIQDARDPVHELELEGMPVAILPCVTVHPGMEALYPISSMS